MKIETESRPPYLSLQERVLGYGALRRVGTAAVNYSIDGEVKTIRNALQPGESFDELAGQFRSDPKNSLAFMRQNLIAIGADDRLSKFERNDRLGRYVDAYTSLTVKLDHAAFPGDGVVRSGVPGYIPDGFIDMGGYRSIDPMLRGGRDQMKVDKAAIYRKHKGLLLEVFSKDWSGVDSTMQKRLIADKLLAHVYKAMPYNHDIAKGVDENGGRIVDLHGMDSGVCRHLALNYQVLAQACGLTSRYVKCDVDGERHAANAVRINHDWWLVDPTIPDYEKSADGKCIWKPGSYPIDHEPRNGDLFRVIAKHSGQRHTYAIHDRMFWRIPRHQ